jgi:LysM repeat protein
MKYTVKPGDNLAGIAKQFNVEILELKKKNRLLTNFLKVGQTLDIPDSITKKEESLATQIFPSKINNIKNNPSVEQKEEFYAEEKTKILPEEDKVFFSETKEINQEKENKNILNLEKKQIKHIVQIGETLYTIAKKYDMSVSTLKHLNPLISANHLRAGIELNVLAYNLENNHINIENEATSHEKELPDEHIVERGESLYSIAQKYNISIEEIKNFNQLNIGTLTIGQKIYLKPQNISIKLSEMLEEEKEEEPQKEDKKTTQNHQRTEKNVFFDINITSNPKVKNLSLFEENRERAMYFDNFGTNNLAVWKIFEWEIEESSTTLGEGLRQAVGRNHVQRPEDLQKLQKRLIQLKCLESNHSESPENLYQKYGKIAITSNLIPQTIAGIEKFQREYDVHFWFNHPQAQSMFGKAIFMVGAVRPQDLTSNILSNFAKYKLTFPHPQNGEQIKVEWQNYVPNLDNNNPSGFYYKGNVQPEIPISVFERLGITDNLAKALQKVIQKNKTFDYFSLATRDDVRFGMIPFSSKDGSLLTFLAYIKHKSPKIFADFFHRFGLDVTYTLVQQEIRQPRLLLVEEDKIFENDQAWLTLANDVRWMAVFIRAGHYLPIVTLQLDWLIREFIRPSLVLLADIELRQLHIPNVNLFQYFRTEDGLAKYFQSILEKGIHLTGKNLKETIEKIAKQRNYRTWAEVKEISEAEILITGF